MSGAGTDGPVGGAKDETGQLIIMLGSAVVSGAVADCLRARSGCDRDRCINARRHRSATRRGQPQLPWRSRKEWHERR